LIAVHEENQQHADPVDAKLVSCPDEFDPRSFIDKPESAGRVDVLRIVEPRNERDRYEKADQAGDVGHPLDGCFVPPLHEHDQNHAGKRNVADNVQNVLHEE